MRAGRLRNRVIIQSKSVTRNDYGEEVETWPEFDTLWGAVEPLRGDEFLEGRREGAELTTRIVIRYRDGITPEMRVSWDGHVYDIRAIIHVEERGREMHLMCRELIP